MRLALRILRPHSLTLTLTLSLSHCLSHLSHLSHLFLISLISLSSLSLSLLSVSRLSVSLLSLLSQEDPGKEPHIKDSSPLPPKRAPCFFLPRCPPLSHSGALAFAPPLASSSQGLRGLICQSLRPKLHVRGVGDHPFFRETPRHSPAQPPPHHPEDLATAGVVGVAQMEVFDWTGIGPVHCAHLLDCVYSHSFQ